MLARTSEPPCFSVIAMPTVTPDLPAAGWDDGSYCDAAIFGTQAAATPGEWRSAAGAVIVIGQHTPGSACAIRNSSAVCSTWPAGPPFHAAEETPAISPSAIS